MKRITRYQDTRGWEAEAAQAATVARRAVSKGRQREGFTPGDPTDIRTAAARLRQAADDLDEMHDQFMAKERQ